MLWVFHLAGKGIDGVLLAFVLFIMCVLLGKFQAEWSNLYNTVWYGCVLFGRSGAGARRRVSTRKRQRQQWESGDQSGNNSGSSSTVLEERERERNPG